MTAITANDRLCLTCQIPMIPRPDKRGVKVNPLPAGYAYHQARDLCSACYQRAAKAQTRAARATRDDNVTARIPRGCTALTGNCHCWACTLAANDHESPAALTSGTWVPGRHGIRIWQEAPAC